MTFHNQQMFSNANGLREKLFSVVIRTTVIAAARAHCVCVRERHEDSVMFIGNKGSLFQFVLAKVKFLTHTHKRTHRHTYKIVVIVVSPHFQHIFCTFSAGTTRIELKQQQQPSTATQILPYFITAPFNCS